MRAVEPWEPVQGPDPEAPAFRAAHRTKRRQVSPDTLKRGPHIESPATPLGRPGATALALRFWRTLLHVAFLLLCLRFLGVTFRGSGTLAAPAAALALAGLALGAWRPQAALFAFTLAAPLLTGLGQLSIVQAPAPPCLVFAAWFVGATLGDAWRRRRGSDRRPGDGAGMDSSPEGRALGRVALAADALITAVLASLVLQICRNAPSPAFWEASGHRAVFGFRDPYYFLTSAFVWLQGLFYFAALLRVESARGASEDPGNARDRPPGAGAAAWIAPILAAYGIIIVACFAFQSVFHLPETPRYYFPFLPETSLPFEDSHAYGSVVVALLGYHVAMKTILRRRTSALSWAVAGGFLYLVLASWSRAAWMAALLVLLFVAGRLLPRLWRHAVVLATSCILMVLYFLGRESVALQHPFLSRLENLLRVDEPRKFLYHKAFRMIAERPMTGHGIGSCNWTSVHFASPGDPMGNVPDFAHNFLLLITTEQGLVVAALYAALVLWVVGRGIALRRDPGEAPSVERVRVFGAAVALAAYLVTQMTANSLNIYFSNQYFFWFLMAAIASWACRVPRSGSTEGARGA